MNLAKTIIALSLIIVAVLSITAVGQPNGERRAPKEKWEQVSIQARIEAIDWDRREATLRGPEGNLVTIEADESVKRFKEIQVGDLVKAEFWTYIKAEFRDPTPAEMREPLVFLAEEARATKEMPPGAVVGAMVQAVVTVEIISRPDMVVTVKGIRGNYVTIPVADATLIEQLKVGEFVILTYAEAMALTLEKINPVGQK